MNFDLDILPKNFNFDTILSLNILNESMFEDQKIVLKNKLYLFKNLKSLCVSNMIIEEISEDIRHLRQLETVELINELNNPCKMLFPDSLEELINLKILRIVGFILSLFPKTNHNLCDLDLSFSELIEIPPDILLLTNLKELNLEGNKIKNLPKEINKLSELQFINLRNNKLTELPDEITTLRNLTHLDISVNNILFLPENLGNLKNLKIIYSHRNKLRKIPDSVCKLKQLKFLSLYNNQISTIQECLFDLNLEYLNLNGNRINKFPENVKKLKHIGLNVIGIEGQKKE